MPKDLQNDFFVLEQQAAATMRAGNYELAERLFRLMLETVISSARARSTGAREEKNTQRFFLPQPWVLAYFAESIE